ncbi:MAG TPA: hypothetical protein VNG33_14880 [Polyangiaceae bacterium]|nr:hypothetical protein [Polyangiaceae bacterium]
MEGPLLVLKSWALTALAIWVYRKWFQRVAPPTPEFEAFCGTRPVVAALFGLSGQDERVARALTAKLGKRAASVARLGGFPWPHYRLTLAVEASGDQVVLRVVAAEVARTKDHDLPGLATLVREVLNELPEGARAWLHAGTFDNGLVETPPGGWALERGDEKRPRLRALDHHPEPVRLTSLGLREPDAALRTSGYRVDDAVPRVAR